MASFYERILPVEVAEQAAAYLELPDAWMNKVGEVSYTIFGSSADAFDRLLQTSFPKAHAWANAQVEANRHEFSYRLPFTANPSYVAFAIVMYFVMIAALTVVSRILGKRSYRWMGFLHNYTLHLVSLYMCVGLLVSARAAGYSLWNNPAGTSPAEYRVAKLVWLFYVSKVPEWIDTALMVLKQNYHQVTFLHVYHHITIFFIWWIACVAAPCGEAYYSAMVNSGVHVVMYGYYFLTLAFPTGRVRSVLNHFKFVITKGQMTQFAFNCLQSIYDLLYVPRERLRYSARLLELLFWYMVSLLVLFGNFLTKSKKRRDSTGSASPRSFAAGAPLQPMSKPPVPVKKASPSPSPVTSPKRSSPVPEAQKKNGAQKQATSPKQAAVAKQAVNLKNTPKFGNGKKQ